MDSVQMIIVVVSTILIVGVIMKSAGKKGITGAPDAFIVRRSVAVTVLGIVCMLVFAAMLFMATYAWRVQGTLGLDDVPFVFGVAGFFFLLGAYLAISSAQFEIRVVNERIEYTPAIGRTQVLSVNEIAFALVAGMKLKIYGHNGQNHCKIFTLDGPYKGKDSLVAYFQRHGIQFLTAKPAPASGSQGARQRRFLTREEKKARKKLQINMKARREQHRVYMESPPDLPGDFADLLRAVMRPTIGLEPGDAAVPCAVGQSKFGGEPDLPEDFAWDYYVGESYDKTTANRPLTFLLQLNCAEVKAAYPDSPLPEYGLMAFFYELDTMLWGPEKLKDIDYVKVHYFKDTDRLVRTVLPDDLKEGYRVPQHPISFSKEESIPPYNEFEPTKKYTSNFANHKLYDQIRASLGARFTRHGEIAMNTRIFGWPESIQSGVFNEFTEMYLRSMDSTAAVPKDVRDVLDGAQSDLDWELLLQLDSGVFDQMDCPAIMFGDYGNLYFGIRREDLAAKRFDQTWFTLQCT